MVNTAKDDTIASMSVKNSERIKMEKREFSFRVWHEKKEYMYDNVAIGLAGKVLYLRGSPKKKGADWYVSEDIEEGIVTMQYTGMKDDRKRKIFEGDVVKVGAQEKQAQVVWNNDFLRYELNFIEEKRVVDFSDKRSLRQIQVIGNIYENPELVGGEPRANSKNVDYDLDVEEEEDLEE